MTMRMEEWEVRSIRKQQKGKGKKMMRTKG